MFRKARVPDWPPGLMFDASDVKAVVCVSSCFRSSFLSEQQKQLLLEQQQLQQFLTSQNFTPVRTLASLSRSHLSASSHRM